MGHSHVFKVETKCYLPKRQILIQENFLIPFADSMTCKVTIIILV